MKYLILSLWALGITLQVTAQNKKVNDKDLLKLLGWMSGSFSSHDQSVKDTANYYDIRLSMKRIWPQRTDGYWLYVEQATASALHKPYRQRVYHLFLSGDTCVVSEVFTLVNPLQYAGAWKKEQPLDSLEPARLESRSGCSIYLYKQSKKTFAGSTRGKDCPSNLRGAAYATSEVVVSAKELRSWDRGFDGKDVQVWGAEKGPYLFRKTEKFTWE